MDKKRVLLELSFGERVAEEESRQLSNYFVETHHWRRIYAGEADVVYGRKGAGKSAIYALLMQKQAELLDRGVLIVGAENPRGTPAFKQLLVDPPASESEFVNLWKLYVLSLLAEAMRDYGLKGEAAKRVVNE